MGTKSTTWRRQSLCVSFNPGLCQDPVACHPTTDPWQEVSDQMLNVVISGHILFQMPKEGIQPLCRFSRIATCMSRSWMQTQSRHLLKLQLEDKPTCLPSKAKWR